MVALGRCGEANDKTEAVNVLVQETWKHGSIYAILSDVKDSVCIVAVFLALSLPDTKLNSSVLGRIFYHEFCVSLDGLIDIRKGLWCPDNK